MARVRGVSFALCSLRQTMAIPTFFSYAASVTLLTALAGLIFVKRRVLLKKSAAFFGAYSGGHLKSKMWPYKSSNPYSSTWKLS